MTLNIVARGTMGIRLAAARKLVPQIRVILESDCLMSKAGRVEAMEKAVAELEKAGRFAEAIAPAREVLAIRQIGRAHV